MVFRSEELNFVERFLKYAMVHKLSSGEHDMLIFFWFNKSKSSTTRDMKSLSMKMNHTGLVPGETS